ncbi:MAG: 50S ribosomal protein L18 [Deltaproteobacteria bacterium]|nr:50S ribosomal protein L18 [Deltaproteobacteria bacterium]
MSESALAKRKKARLRTKIRIRKKIVGTGERPRLSIFKSSKHIYGQIISDVSGETLVSASTLDKDLQAELSALGKDDSHNNARSSKSVASARAVGRLLAKRSLDKKIEHVVFDRNGYVFKGRVKAVADGAREAGLKV